MYRQSVFHGDVVGFTQKGRHGLVDKSFIPITVNLKGGTVLMYPLAHLSLPVCRFQQEIIWAVTVDLR